MRRQDKKSVIQEANERFEKRYLNEDTTDLEDAHHSEDPAQIDMFTQQDGEDRVQIIKQFVKDNNVYLRLKDMINAVDGIDTDFEDMMGSFVDLMREKEESIEGDTNIEQLWRDMEELGGTIMGLEDSIYYIKNGIDKVVMSKDDYHKKENEVLRKAMEGYGE